MSSTPTYVYAGDPISQAGVIAGLAVLAVPTGVLASSSDDSAPHLGKRLTDQNKEGSR